MGGSFIITNLYKQVLLSVKITEEGARQFLGSNPFSIEEVWHTMGYVSSLLVTIPALLVIMHISNEYRFKTYKQNIINGWSRDQAFTAKLLGVIAFTTLITALYVAVCLVVVSFMGGGQEQGAVRKDFFIGCFFLQTLAQLSIAFMLGYFLRRSFLALTVFIFWPILFETLLGGLISKFNPVAAGFLPFEISDRLIPPPGFVAKMDPELYARAMANVGPHVIYTIIFTLLIWVLGYWINKSRNL